MAKTLMPWGKNMPQSTTGRAGKPRGTSTSRPSRPHASLRSMKYPTNRPSLWPVEGQLIKRGTSVAAANRHNAIVNRVFQRAGYAG